MRMRIKFFMDKLGTYVGGATSVRSDACDVNSLIARLIVIVRSRFYQRRREQDQCSPLGEESAMISFSSFGPALVTSSGKPNHRLGMGRKLTVVSAVSLSLLLLLALVFGRCGRYG